MGNDKLMWQDGTVTDVQIDKTAWTLSVSRQETVHTAELRDDKIHWSDGTLWKRSPGTLQVGALTVAESAHATEAQSHSGSLSTEAPATNLLEETLPSPVGTAEVLGPPEPKADANAPPAVKLGTKTAAGEHKEFEPVPLREQRALFAVAAQMREANEVPLTQDKKPRKEKAMCCC